MNPQREGKDLLLVKISLADPVRYILLSTLRWNSRTARFCSLDNRGSFILSIRLRRIKDATCNDGRASIFSESDYLADLRQHARATKLTYAKSGSLAREQPLDGLSELSADPKQDLRADLPFPSFRMG
jgi:hypothetical protein